MTTTKAISSNDQINNGGTIVKAGNFTTGNITNGVTLAENASDKLTYGSQVLQATEVDESGNVGGIAAGAGDFAGMVENTYVINGLNTYQIANNRSLTGTAAGDKGTRRLPTIWPGYERLDITSWDYVTGDATLGGNAGGSVQPSGVDGTVGNGADDAVNPTNAIPGRLVYLTTGKLATSATYSAKTNP